MLPRLPSSGWKGVRTLRPCRLDARHDRILPCPRLFFSLRGACWLVGSLALWFQTTLDLKVAIAAVTDTHWESPNWKALIAAPKCLLAPHPAARASSAHQGLQSGSSVSPFANYRKPFRLLNTVEAKHTDRGMLRSFSSTVTSPIFREAFQKVSINGLCST